ncbi:hypothetical protein THAOC_18701 [Thalassiosira oceanica]|uniref:Uncharacterized protein n=1 Tax=Thalassiosira oceanica TaxID=159749 RepID=K0S7H1_THAOC|nr:hypothetical protein THAOC_18701 [Thalassiosira oceanica]|eukprot:EJK60884.1 hypothetical protein THAOC_18701 [Thalassiosira oceanica]
MTGNWSTTGQLDSCKSGSQEWKKFGLYSVTQSPGTRERVVSLACVGGSYWDFDQRWTLGVMWRAWIQSVEASDSEDSSETIGVESDNDDDVNVNDNRGGGDASVSNINRGGEDLREEHEQDRTNRAGDGVVVARRRERTEATRKTTASDTTGCTRGRRYSGGGPPHRGHGRSSSPAGARRVRSPGTSSTSWAAAWDPRRPGGGLESPGRPRVPPVEAQAEGVGSVPGTGTAQCDGRGIHGRLRGRHVVGAPEGGGNTSPSVAIENPSEERFGPRVAPSEGLQACPRLTVPKPDVVVGIGRKVASRDPLVELYESLRIDERQTRSACQRTSRHEIGRHPLTFPRYLAAVSSSSSREVEKAVHRLSHRRAAATLSLLQRGRGLARPPTRPREAEAQRLARSITTVPQSAGTHPSRFLWFQASCVIRGGLLILSAFAGGGANSVSHQSLPSLQQTVPALSTA